MDILAVSILIGAGFIAGIAGGFFGIGGGTIFIPLLLTIFKQMHIQTSIEMHIAITTSLALIIPTAISSSTAQYRNKNIDFQVCLSWLPGIAIGTIIGSILVHVCSGIGLKIFFMAYLLFCIINTLYTKSHIEGQTPTKIPSTLRPLSVVVGTFSAMLGTGGGTFTTPILHFFGYSTKRSIAISSITGLIIGIVGSTILTITGLSTPDLPAFCLGYLNWLLFIIISPTAIVGSYLGVTIANRQSKETIDLAYLIFLCAIFLLMTYQLVH